jgi:Spy/CpxP family protein refolding chaperone
MLIFRGLALALFFTASAWAAPASSDAPPRPMCKSPFERSLEALKPAPDLEKKLRAIDEKQGDATRQARSDMRDKKRALYQGFESTAPKEDDLKKVFDDFNAASSALNKARFDSELQVWRLLTPEQRKIWFTYRKCSRDGMMPPAGMPMHKMPMGPKKPPMSMDNPMDSPMDDR